MFIIHSFFVSQIIDSFHTFFILKLTYYLETTIFIITGKFKLLTTYIIVHHSTYPILIWYALVAAPGGHAIFFIFVNLLTHFLYMSHQLIVLPFPRLKQPWSRSFLIWLHIIQFTLMMAHGAQLLLDNFCNFPIKITYISIVWGAFIIGLYIVDWCQNLCAEDKKVNNQKSKNVYILNWETQKKWNDIQVKTWKRKFHSFSSFLRYKWTFSMQK